jgi:hypothetical protein
MDNAGFKFLEFSNDADNKFFSVIVFYGMYYIVAFFIGVFGIHDALGTTKTGHRSGG